MPYGPYHYQNGNKYTFGADGRWWLVTSSLGGDDYGYPVSARAPAHHSRHHGHSAFAPPIPAAHHHTAPRGPSRRVGTAGPEDPWQGNSYARELFQGQGARYFVGADHLVVRTTEAAAILYTAAFFAPQLLATARLAAGSYQQGILGGALNRYFWSGGFAIAGLRAAELAEENGGITLEGTPLGLWLSDVTPNTMWLWKVASWAYATGAQGVVYSVQGDSLGIRSVWATIEYGILFGKNEIQILSATGRWQ